MEQIEALCPKCGYIYTLRAAFESQIGKPDAKFPEEISSVVCPACRFEIPVEPSKLKNAETVRRNRKK